MLTHAMCADVTLATRYRLVAANMHWVDASLYCNAYRMSLVSILNSDEHLALQAYIESAKGLLCRSSPLLTATGFVNGRGQF